MIKLPFPKFYLIALIATLYLSMAGFGREVVLLNTNWKFHKGDIAGAFEKYFNDSAWQVISIPHDWAIEGPSIIDGDGNTGKLPWKGDGWYRKKLDIDESFRGQRIYLLFDGIMASPKVYLNGKLAGEWDYGYNSFYLDITELIDFTSDNILAIHANTNNHDSRWYPGAGIYRKVQLIAVNPVHVEIWGTYVTTPMVAVGAADVNIKTNILNKSAQTEGTLNIEHIIFNQKGFEVARNKVKTTTTPGKNISDDRNFSILKPILWDIDNPYLYKLETIISKDGKVLDSYTTSFGIRTIAFTSNDGFQLNGSRVQLKGVCLHHDQGLLGAAFNKRAMQRQIEIMKSMGCNAIRTSHNVPAPELLDLCDEMGILVFNEGFDKYDEKADITAATDFEEFAQRNIRNFVCRDRNHPSVFIWSVGNEMWDIQNNKNDGFKKMNIMLDLVRAYDPSRPTTMVCDHKESAYLKHFNFYDVHCWNYGRRYELARNLEPKKSVIISESASTVSTRGFYELPFPLKHDVFTPFLQVSSYDLNAPSWAELADDDFMWQQEDPFVAGEFVWTGFDYIGEPTPYQNSWVKKHFGFTDKEASRSSYFGIVDLCGIPKDRYYLYKSLWKPGETTLHILPHWNWGDSVGKNIPVFVYTNGDCAELFLNGVSLGKKCKNPTSVQSIERFRLMWNDVSYQPGELKVVAYLKNIVIGEQTMKTADEPYQLKLTPDRSAIAANGEDLSYILVEAMDKDGNFCPLADNRVEIKLLGVGNIAGVGNGNPQSLDPFKAQSVKLFYGKAMIIVGSGTEKGNVELEAACNGLKEAKVNITVE